MGTAVELSMVAFAPPMPGVGTFRWGRPAGVGVSGSCTVSGCPFFAPASCACALCRFPGAWKALTPAQDSPILKQPLKAACLQ